MTGFLTTRALTLRSSHHFIHDNNILELYEEINKAIYELNRNGNS